MRSPFALRRIKKLFLLVAFIAIFAPFSAQAACPFDCTDLATATGNINTTGQTLTNDINAGSTYGAASIISGTGNVVVTDVGATANFWQLSSANTFSGTMTVQNHATVFSTANNVVGNAATVTIATGGAFNIGTTSQTFHNLTGGGGIITGTGSIVTENGTGTFSGVISGAGSLATTGTGNLTLSGTNTYTGTTTVGSGTTLTLSIADAIAQSSGLVNNGTLALGTTSQTLGNLSGAGNITVGSGATLTETTTGASTYSGVISGAGGVAVGGTGTWTLTPVTQTYTGATTVLSGATLNNNAILASSVTVNSGASLTGAGTSANVTNNGSFTPGNLTGSPYSVSNGFTQGSNGQLNINFDDGHKNEIDVDGTATLSGTIAYNPQTPASKYTRGATFTIVSADTVTGTFTKSGDGTAMPASNVSTAANDPGIAGSSDPFLAIKTFYFSDSVIARIVRAESFEASGVTSTEQAVGAALDAEQIAAENGSDMDTLLNVLSNVPTANQPAALDELSGALNASVPTGYRDGQRAFDGMLAKRLGGDCNSMKDSPVSSGFMQPVNAYGGQRYYPVVYSAVPGRGRASWACGYGNFGHIDADGNAPRITTGGTGGAAGIELNSGARTQIRAGIGYSNNTLESDLDEANLNSYQAGVYGQLTGRHVYAGLGASGAYNTGSTIRHIIFPGLNRAAIGDLNGYSFGGNGTAGVYTNFGRIRAELGANVEYIYTNQDAYQETGAGAADLDVASQTLNSLRTSLQAQANTSYSLSGSAVLTPEIRAGIFNDAMDVTPSVQQSFTGTGVPFTVTGPNPGRTGFMGGMGATVSFRRLSLFGDYNGTFKSHETSHMIVGGMKLKW